MNQGYKPVISKLFFPAVRDGNFRWAFQSDVPIVGTKRVGRQSFYQSAAFHAPNGGAPSVLAECIGQSCSQRIGSVAPQILIVMSPVNTLLVVKCVNLLGISSIGQTHKDVGRDQSDVA